MKTCTKCGKTKEFSEFYKNKRNKDGYHFECKTCKKERDMELKKSPIMQLEKAVVASIITENKLLFKEGKKLCCLCKNIFLIATLQGRYCQKCASKKNKEYREKNKEKIAKAHKKYRIENKEKINEKNKEYYEKNIEKMKEYKKQYHEQYQKENKEKINEYQRQRHHKLKEGN